MKKFAYLALSGTALLLTLAACNKDKDSDPTPALPKTDLLTAKNWKLTDIRIAGASVYSPSFFEACSMDDLYKFNTNKLATFDEGALNCDPTSPQSGTGSWEFTTNETKLKITNPDGDVAEGAISTLTSNTLILSDVTGSTKITGSIDGDGKFDMTYTAQ